MKSKLITYDLCAPGRNYELLYEKIKSYGPWVCITESAWLISSPYSCQDIKKDLLSVIDASDRIFVTEIGDDAEWYNILCDDLSVSRHYLSK